MPELFPRILLLLGGVGALYFGAEWLIRGAASLASRVGVSPIVVGLTVVSLGTSTPEMAVSIAAAVQGSSDIAIGNVLGSNLANIGLVMGFTAMVQPLEVNARVVIREIPIMILITLCVIPLAWADGGLDRGDGIILLVLLGFYLLYVLRASKDESAEIKGEFEEFLDEGQGTKPWPHRVLVDLGLIVIGVSALVIGGRAIVEGATYIARAIGISDLVIGLTVIAVGTSLPELATSVVAAVRKEADIAVGNVIGSNIFNIGAVLGVTSIVSPVPVPSQVLRFHLPAVVFISLLVLPLARTHHTVKRIEGTFLFAAYIGLGAWLFW
jgi:cation:H+ antiporter